MRQLALKNNCYAGKWKQLLCLLKSLFIGKVSAIGNNFLVKWESLFYRIYSFWLRERVLRLLETFFYRKASFWLVVNLAGDNGFCA